MERRTVLGITAVGAAGVGGYFYREDDSTAGDNGRTDTGGFLGYGNVERLEWGDFGELTLVFSDDHGSDFFTISHALNADDGNNYILLRESPDFGGEVAVDFGTTVQEDGRDFPSREFAIDYYKGQALGVVATVDEHLGTDEFEVPDDVDLSGGTTISG